MRRWMPARVTLAFALSAMLVAMPTRSEAQEATLSGTVVDTTEAVLPGVTATATLTMTGNTFVSISNERGQFRIPVRAGEYLLTLELQGFTTVRRTVNLLVGQEAVVNLQMSPSTLQETVTVTGEAPLLNVTTSALGGNIDPKQLQALPINGRDWQNLSLMAPGNRANATADSPVEGSGAAGAGAGSFQLNVDGQQVTNLIAGSAFGNPKFSRDAISEFQFIANRFDATQGRSSGVQVNAISKSGTNIPAGTFGGYFRNDSMNAADHVVGRVLPYSDQQLSGTFGGPIVKNRIHFFGNFEYEHEPQSFAWTTPYPAFNFDDKGTHREKNGGARIDVQFSSSTHMAVKYSGWRNFLPYAGSTGGIGNVIGGATSTPNAPLTFHRWTNDMQNTLTKVLGSRGFNELKAGYAEYGWTNEPQVKNPNSPFGTGVGAPSIVLRGITIGPVSVNSPQRFNQKTTSARDDFSYSYDWRGRHDLKVGGEYLYYSTSNSYCFTCQGQLFANVVNPPANLPSLFPNLFDFTTWNLAPLSPLAVRWVQGIGDFKFPIDRNVVGSWAQDDWAIARRLTLNLGVRYDLQLNAFVNNTEVLPFLPGHRPNDKNNIAPRFGAVYRVNDRTVVRGGFGRYFGDVGILFSTRIQQQALMFQLFYDGRPDFASNPWNGPLPTYAQLLPRLCNNGSNPLDPTCVRRDLNVPSGEIPYSYQGSIGFQRELASDMAIAADYMFTGNRGAANYNANLTYNPATRANYPFTDLARRKYPDWGVLTMPLAMGSARDNLNMLQSSFTKRYTHRWQMQANYTLSVEKDATDPPIKEFPIAPDLYSPYGQAAGDQRHRFVTNGVWDVGRGFQVSGLYFYGSGDRFVTTWGADLRGVAPAGTGGGSAGRLRTDGSIIPRNNLKGLPLHRVDVRLQQGLPITARARVEGIFEVFNLFDHANFGSYTTTETSTSYGKPTYNGNVSYGPRTVQLGFRITF